jgi:glycosyltransferase involved in cell wall biosynthesis
MTATPRVSVIIPTHDHARYLPTALDSALGQTLGGVEVVVVDDGSTDDTPAVAERYQARVTWLTQECRGPAAARNAALARARGEFVALLDHDDVLESHAIEVVLKTIDESDDPGAVDYVYSDQASMTEGGRRHRPFRKPDWSPERFRHHMYTTHFSVLRRELVLEVGGFRAGYEGSQDHDLVLRVTERASVVLHVPEVLYYWREVPGSAAADPEAKPYAWDNGVLAVQSHLDRVGIDAVAAKGCSPGHYLVTRTPDLDTPVSVIIPTIGTKGIVFGRQRTLVVEAVRSILATSRHRDIEFVVVYDQPTPADVLDELRAIPGVKLRLVLFTQPFNFSAKCNVGALHASGDVLLFLNDDTQADSEGFLENLIAPLREPGVGGTGPKLIFENSRIQHAGIIYGSGTIHHSYYGSPRDSIGHHGELVMNREVSGLTGACLALRRDVFVEAGGFNEALPGNYNDVDFGQKVRLLGYRLIWLHEPTMFHFESISRESGVHDWETAAITKRWGDYRVVRERLVNGR